MNFDTQYKQIISRCLEQGTLRKTRDVDAYSILGITIEHDMSEGFPATTLKKLPFKSMAVETDFYLKGLRDKSWLQERGCHFWDQWSSPQSENKNDLGPTYGYEWRYWGKNKDSKGIDQLKNLITEIKTNPGSKRLLVTQWNPEHREEYAIPPCPFAFQILKYENSLNIIFYQRSVDVCLGLPTDFAQHALLLQLICNETGYKAGKVIGMFGQAELYENHTENAKKMLKKIISKSPVLILPVSVTLDNFDYQKVSLENYKHGKHLSFKISV